MKNIFAKIATTAATSAALLLGMVVNTPNAKAATFGLNWQGSDGYSATGSFSFDDALLGQTINETQLSDLVISFLNSGTVVGSFDYNFPLPANSELNFQFDTTTNTVVQSGAFDTDQGFDLGINFNTGETGLDFYTSNGDASTGQPQPAGTIVLENLGAPGACATFPAPNCDRLSTGGTLTATAAAAVPEPASTLGLLALGALGGSSALKKKLVKRGTNNRSAESVSV